MKQDRPRLSPSAIPAGILLTVYALLCFFALRIINGMFDPFQVICAFQLLSLGILLFFRRRFPTIGILLCILSLCSLAGAGYWLSLDATLPVFLSHAVRAVVFFAAALVCFRRLSDKRIGAWWLAAMAGILFCAWLMIGGIDRIQSAFIGEAEIGKICLLLASADTVLYIGIFLLTLAFSGRPEKKAPPAPEQPAYPEAEYEILPDGKGGQKIPENQ